MPAPSSNPPVPPLPPGRKWQGAVADVLSMTRNQSTFQLEHVREFGNVFHASVAGSDLFFLSGAAGMRIFYDPAMVARLPGAPERIMKAAWRKGGKLALPPLDGTEHLTRKHNFLRTTSEAQIASYLPVMSARIEAAAKRWAGQPEWAVNPECNRVILSMLTEIFFSTPLPDGAAGDRIIEAVQRHFNIFDRALPINLPWTKVGRSIAAVEEILYPYLQQILDDHRKNPSDDAVGTYLKGPGAAYDDDTILTDMLQYFIGGYGVVCAVPLLVHSLVTHPDVVARLRQEAAGVEADLAGPITPGVLRKLPYARAVVQESLRYWPNIPLLLGQALQDIDVGGYRIPKGSSVMACLYATCHDPAVYTEPELYDPDRFFVRNEGSADPEYGGYTVAFGAGPNTAGHSCAGNLVALSALTLAAVHLARNWSWELANPNLELSTNPIPAGIHDDFRLKRVAVSSPRAAFVHVFGARGLSQTDPFSGASDPFVVAEVVEAGTVSAEGTVGARKRRTRVKNDSSTPVWDQGFALDADGFTSPELVIRLFDRDVAHDDLVGEVRLPLATLAPGRQDHPVDGGTLSVACHLGPTIFPHDAPAPAPVADSRTISGRLLFAGEDPNKPRPIRNVRVELWDLHVLDNDRIADGYTDKNGDFTLTYNAQDVRTRLDPTPHLVVRVTDREFSYDRTGAATSTWQAVASIDVGHAEPHLRLEPRYLSFWGYENPERLQAVAFTPRVEVIDRHPPQEQKAGRTHAQLLAGLNVITQYNGDLLVSKFSDERPTCRDIEKDYPLNATRKMGREASRSDAYLCEIVLNGFNPCLFKKDEEGLYVDFRWNCLEQDGKHFAPNTTARFHTDGVNLFLDRIDVAKRVGGDASAHAAYRAPKSYTPADGPVWDRVKRLFRVNYFLFGEVTTHLTETHLNLEQYIVPLRRNVHLSPIAQLLRPHLTGTVAVNVKANEILIATDAIVQMTSALTPSSTGQLAVTDFGGLNWKSFSPREPLCANHRYAKAGKIFWDMLEDYVSDFFRKHDAGIRAHWSEIHAFSDELVSHALPWVDPIAEAYVDSRELNRRDVPHPLRNGSPAAISPVTTHDEVDEDGLANLRQLCKYILFYATFKHSWVNDRQYEMGGEIEFATLGVEDDITNLDIDESGVVPPRQAIEHPFLTYVLNFTEYGYIVRNEDDSVNPDFIRALVSRRAELAQLGLDVRNVRSTINT